MSKIRNLSIKVLSITMLLLSLTISGCNHRTSMSDSVTSILQKDNKYINTVKQGSLDAYPDLAIGKAFDSYFGNPNWKYFKAENGEEVVEFTGYCMYAEKEVKATLQFLITLDENVSSFKIEALEFNEVPQTELIKLALLSSIFEDIELLEASAHIENNNHIPTNKADIHIPEEIPSDMNNIKQLNRYFSIVYTGNIPSFNTDNLSLLKDEDIINFSLSYRYHDYRYTPIFKEIDSNTTALSKKQVESDALQFFGINEIDHQSTSWHPFDGQYYTTQHADGGGSCIAKVDTVTPISDDVYEVSGINYMAPNAFAGNPDDPVEEWDKLDDFRPERASSFIARMQKQPATGKFILVGYELQQDSESAYYNDMESQILEVIHHDINNPKVLLTAESDSTEDGVEYYVYRAYTDSPTHIATVGWYYVAKDTLKIYEHDLADNILIPLSTPIQWNYISSSSQLTDTLSTYHAKNVADNNTNTIWAEGIAGNGIGEWIYFENTEGEFIHQIDIINGFSKSESLYYQNNRVKKLRLDFDSGYSIFPLLDDSLSPQTITFNDGVLSSSVKATILEIYPGTKYEDTCISEISIYK